MKIWLSCCLSSVLLLMGNVQAGAGHDHGMPEANSVNSVADNTPRLVMSSEQFELVGIVEDKNIHLYLDDFATNAPISEADIELEITGEQLKAEDEGGGTYHITLEHELKDGLHPVLATILTTATSDLLTGELDIHTEEEEKQEEAPQGILVTPLQLIIVLSSMGVFLLLFIIVIRRDAHRQEHTS